VAHPHDRHSVGSEPGEPSIEIVVRSAGLASDRAPQLARVGTGSIINDLSHQVSHDIGDAGIENLFRIGLQGISRKLHGCLAGDSHGNGSFLQIRGLFFLHDRGNNNSRRSVLELDLF
jgi:hypothetical protein